MTDYVSLLLETGAAKKRVAELFESEALGAVDHLPVVTAAQDQSRVGRPSAKAKKKLFPEYRSKQGPVRDRARTPIPDMESGQMTRDLTVSSFMLALVLVGVLLAAHTERPVFWLLIGPTPLVILHTIRTFCDSVWSGAKGCSRSANGIDDFTKLYKIQSRSICEKTYLISSLQTCGEA
jgi:hypothetical protein